MLELLWDLAVWGLIITVVVLTVGAVLYFALDSILILLRGEA